MTPVIETDRLRMRGHAESDLDASMTMWGHPDVYRFISGKPGTREECWGRLTKFAGHWALKGFGYWLVEEKATGAFVGEVGFSDFLRDIVPAIDGSMEAGWVLSPAHHGKGYASEAVSAAIDWAKTHFPQAALTCLIHPENAASINVAKKAGFKERCFALYKDEDTILLDWKG